MKKKKYFIAGLVVIFLVSVVLLVSLRAKNKPLAQASEELAEIENIQPSPTAVDVTSEITETPKPIVITPSPEVVEESPKAILETPNPWPTKKPEPKIVEVDPKDMYFEELINESNYVLRDTYKSNIQIDTEKLWSIDTFEKEWFHPTPIRYDYLYMYICYAIETYYETYYDSEVLCDYYFENRIDVVKCDPDISTALVEYVVHGERPLHICIDFYNYRINVREIDDDEIEYLKSLNLDKLKQ